MNFSALRSLTALFSASLLLTACGGGGADAPAVAPPATVQAAPVMSLVTGTVTGFGSIFIDGQRLDDSVASVMIENNPAALTGAALSDVKLGMQVEGRVLDGKLSELTVRPALMGAATAVDPVRGTFRVHGQAVRVMNSGVTPTVYDGLSGLAGLAVGDQVEVHGSMDAVRQIMATRIERKARNDTAAGVRLVGLLSALDSGGRTFKLNDLTVDYAVAALLPAGKALAEGQLVSVYAPLAPANGVMVAKAVKIAASEEGSALGLGGRIMNYGSLADFTVAGVKGDASAASIEGGSVADLVAGQAVAIEGRVSTGVLRALRLRVLKTADDVKASLSGQVSDFVALSSLRVRGAAVDASTAVFRGGTAAELANGASVRIGGKVQGDVLKAESVDFIAPTAVGGSIKLTGEVRDLNRSAATLRVLAVPLKWTTTVQTLGGTLSDLGNGMRVEVTGSPASDGSATLNVSKIEFHPQAANPPSTVTGRVSDLLATGFKLPGLNVLWARDTVFLSGVIADLNNGIEVVVTGHWNAQLQSLVALRIEVRRPEDKPQGVAVRGAVSDVASKAAFRIGMQRVDASEAVYAAGDETDLTVGRTAEGVGTIVDVAGIKTLKLSQIRMLN